MQASLRSNYQYYDYTTLDCASRIQHLQEHADSSLAVEHQQQDLHHHQQHHHGHQLINQVTSNGETVELHQLDQLAQASCCTNLQPSVEQQQQQHLLVYDPQQFYRSHIQQVQPDGQLTTTQTSVNNNNEDIESCDHLKGLYADQNAIGNNCATYQTIYYDPTSFSQENHLSAQDEHIGPPAFAAQSSTRDTFAPLNQQLPEAASQDAAPSYFGHYVQQQPAEVAGGPQYVAQVVPSQQPTYQVSSYHDLNRTEFLLDSQQVTLQQHTCESVDRATEEEHQEYRQLQTPKSTYNNQYYADPKSTGLSTVQSHESFSSAASMSSLDSDDDDLSEADDSSSVSSSLTRDERRAREANIPMTYYEIVNLSIDQFNEQLARHNLAESQLTLIKDIRRRGKNKVAAQSCRKRKMEQIQELQHEVNHLASKRRSLSCERTLLSRERDKLVLEYDRIYAIIRDFNDQNIGM